MIIAHTFSAFELQDFVLDRHEEKRKENFMYCLVYMDEVSKGNVINRPLPPKDSTPEERASFTKLFFKKVLQNYKVLRKS